MENITPALLKRIRSSLREGDITELVKRTGLSRQTIHKQLRGDGINDTTRQIVANAKSILQEQHDKDKELLAKI